MSELSAAYDADPLGHKRPSAVSVKSVASDGCENACPSAKAEEQTAVKKSTKACATWELQRHRLEPRAQL